MKVQELISKLEGECICLGLYPDEVDVCVIDDQDFIFEEFNIRYESKDLPFISIEL